MVWRRCAPLIGLVAHRSLPEAASAYRTPMAHLARGLPDLFFMPSLHNSSPKGEFETGKSWKQISVRFYASCRRLGLIMFNSVPGTVPRIAYLGPLHFYADYLKLACKRKIKHVDIKILAAKLTLPLYPSRPLHPSRPSMRSYPVARPTFRFVRIQPQPPSASPDLIRDHSAAW